MEQGSVHFILQHLIFNKYDVYIIFYIQPFNSFTFSMFQHPDTFLRLNCAVTSQSVCVKMLTGKMQRVVGGVQSYHGNNILTFSVQKVQL